MPITDPEKSRTYQREDKRLVRSGSRQTPGQTDVPAEFRLATASDVLAMFGEQGEIVMIDDELVRAPANAKPYKSNEKALPTVSAGKAVKKRGRRGSNPQPPDRQSGTLTN